MLCAKSEKCALFGIVEIAEIVEECPIRNSAGARESPGEMGAILKRGLREWRGPGGLLIEICRKCRGRTQS